MLKGDFAMHGKKALFRIVPNQTIGENMKALNTKHVGNLKIYTKADAKKYSHITEVTGYLDISADAQLPALTVAHGVKGRLLAIHQYGLWLSEEYKYYAGCKAR